MFVLFMLCSFGPRGPDPFTGKKITQTLSVPLDSCSARVRLHNVEQCLTTALFTARADGSSASPAPQDFCKACLWQLTDASIDLRDPNTN